MIRHRLVQYLLIFLLAAGGCSRDTVDDEPELVVGPAQKIADPLLYLYQQQAVEYAARALHPDAREAFLKAAHRCWELDGRKGRDD